MGGFIGRFNNGISQNFSSSYNKGNVVGNHRVGGFVGGNLYAKNVFVYDSYNAGEIRSIGAGTGNSAGGIWGSTSPYNGVYMYVYDSFSIGKIAGSLKGGLMGYSNSGRVLLSNSYYYFDSELQNIACVADASNIITPNCTMESMTYFYDFDNAPMNTWDFENVWDGSNSGTGQMPLLKWQVE